MTYLIVDRFVVHSTGIWKKEETQKSYYIIIGGGGVVLQCPLQYLKTLILPVSTHISTKVTKSH